MPEATFVDWKVPEGLGGAANLTGAVRALKTKYCADPKMAFGSMKQRVVCVPIDPHDEGVSSNHCAVDKLTLAAAGFAGSSSIHPPGHDDEQEEGEEDGDVDEDDGSAD